MGASTKIEWTDATWNPIRARNRATGKVGWHCTHASEGCRWCYAEGINKRLGTGLAYKPGHARDIEIFLDERMLMQPLRWRAPRKIFVGSMTDLFGEFVPDEIIDRVFAVMALCPQHTFQVLTKRPPRMRAYCSDPTTPRRIYEIACDLACDLGLDIVLAAPGVEPPAALRGPRVYLDTWPLPNVWLGTSCEDQATANERIPHLLATPAAVRFLSAEPLLGPMDLARLGDATMRLNALTGHAEHLLGMKATTLGRLDQVIVGGESGPHARPMHPDWARSLRDQCQAAGVSFFFKQWGEWIGADEKFDDLQAGGATILVQHGRPWSPQRPLNFDDAIVVARVVGARTEHQSDGSTFLRVGKARAGRLLDGRTWDERPAVPAVRRDAA